MTRYVRHKDGAVQSVTDEDFAENYWINSIGFKGAGQGGTVLDPDFTEVTEDEAHEGCPQLFGGPDLATERMLAAREPGAPAVAEEA
jgi:hypothetical protein